ncbi:MAG: hypothetical protein FWD57_02330 [Polyangiaceae bacterium]|nr:hypothetical protein [Polyangiaceae bacterium]
MTVPTWSIPPTVAGCWEGTGADGGGGIGGGGGPKPRGGIGAALKAARQFLQNWDPGRLVVPQRGHVIMLRCLGDGNELGWIAWIGWRSQWFFVDGVGTRWLFCAVRDDSNPGFGLLLLLAHQLMVIAA